MTKRKILKSHSDIAAFPLTARKGSAGTILQYDPRPEWKGWIQCTLDDGQTGWISESYLEILGERVTFVKDYDAREIRVEAGEEVEVLWEDNGWAWIRKADGNEGWIPAQSY